MDRRDFLKVLSTLPLLYLSDKSKFEISRQYSSARKTNSPNILFIIFDTYSAKHSSLFGYPRQTNSRLEDIANQATVYHQHYASGNFTCPGTASLLTGVYPWTHRVFHNAAAIGSKIGLPDIFSSMGNEYYSFAYTHNPLVHMLLHELRKSISELKEISDLCITSSSLADKLFNKDYSAAFEAENLQYRNLAYPSGSLFFTPVSILQRMFNHYSIINRYKDDYPRGVSRITLKFPPHLCISG